LTGRPAADRAGHPLASVHHDGSTRYVVPVGETDLDRLRLGDLVRLRVRVGRDAPVDRVFVRTAPDGEQVLDELAEAAPGPACRWFEGTVRLIAPVTDYRFLVVGDAGALWLNGRGLHRPDVTDRDDFRLVAGFDPPTWLADRVFYQVFPDRFANGDPANDVGDDAWVYRGHPTRRRDWLDRPSDGPGGSVEFFGGDLAGVEARLDHLVNLGVNAIYLNPVFESRSNHGYDTTDYTRVAAHLGGDEALLSLRRATAERDIRLILDIAPNHTGAEHPWFLAAQADPAAPTAGYYTFHWRPDDYESWLGVKSLPKLDYRDTRLRDAMYAGDDAILRRWLRPPFSIDGWRIDVANMLGRQGPVQLGGDVARGMRMAAKDANPEAYLVGEHFYDPTDALNGDQWDGVMNYAGFANPVLEWLSGAQYRSAGYGTVVAGGPRATEDVVETLAAFRAAIPWAAMRCQYDLLGSHDTPRVRTVVGDAPGHLRAAFGLLFGYVGVPAFLYGDEVGLRGGEGNASRLAMPWDEEAWDLDHLAFVRTLVRYRVGSRALQAGGFQVLDAGEDWLAFLRDTDDEQVIVVVARGPGGRPAGGLPVAHGALADGTRLVSLLDGGQATIEGGQLALPSMAPGAALWTTDVRGAAAASGSRS
jgi:alpha-glucosidase